MLVCCVDQHLPDLSAVLCLLRRETPANVKKALLMNISGAFETVLLKRRERVSIHISFHLRSLNNREIFRLGRECPFASVLREVSGAEASAICIKLIKRLIQIISLRSFLSARLR